MNTDKMIASTEKNDRFQFVKLRSTASFPQPMFFRGASSIEKPPVPVGTGGN